MTYLIAFILGLTTIFAPTSANLPTYLTEVSTIPAPVVESPAPQVVCEEDMDCWNCETMGNLQCGPIAPVVPCMEDMDCWDSTTMGNLLSGNQMEGDAYASFDAMGANPELTDGMMLTYVDSFTEAPKNFATGEFVVPSVQTEGLYHVLRWDTMHDA